MTAGSTSDPDGGATYLGRLNSRTAARLITKDDHLKRLDKAELAARSAITALTTGPLNIMAALGSGEALIASGLAGIVQVLGEAAIWATAGGVWWLRPSPRWSRIKSRSGFNMTRATSHLRFRQLSRRQQHLITRK
jgi:hypothetical protein